MDNMILDRRFIRMSRTACCTMPSLILMWLVNGALMFADDAAMIALLFC